MRRIALTIVILTIGRIAINMTRRFTYPFVPSIARQFAVPVTTIQTIVALQSSSGLVSPVFGPLSERYRRKYVMLIALWGMAIAALVSALVPQLWLFAVVMVVFGVVKAIYDPAMYAYMGDNVPYERRGLALGFGELSWALSLLIIAPVAGILLATSDVGNITALMLSRASHDDLTRLLVSPAGLQLVLLFLSASAFIGGVLVLVFVRGYPPNPEYQTRPLNFRQVVRVIRRSPAAMASVAYAFLIAAANEILFINYGVFMEDRFGLSLALLGSLTIVISLAEVSGEFTVIGIADRFGKRRLTLLGVGLATLTYLVIPFSPSLTFALATLFVLFLGVEIAIVASIPLFTEVLPTNRAIMMSSIAGASALGRLGGALIGGVLLGLIGSFVAVGVVAALISALSFVVLWRYVPDGD